MKMLLVDDEPEVAFSISKAYDWKSEDINVFLATNGEEALNIIKKEHINIMLTDIKMPGMNGIELATQSIKFSPETRVILLTGYDEFEYAREAIKIGVMEYLLKPASIEEIVKSVHTAIDAITEDNLKFKIQTKYSRHLNDNIETLKKDFLKGLAAGSQRYTDSEIRNKCETLKISNTLKYITLLKCSLNGKNTWNENDRSLIVFGIRNIIDEVVNGECEIFADDFGYLVLLTEADQGEAYIYDMMQTVEQAMQIDVFFGIGHKCALNDLYLAYKEAAHIANNRFFYKKKQLTADSNKKSEAEKATTDIEKSLTDYLTLYGENVKSFSEKLFDYFSIATQSGAISKTELTNTCSMLLLKVKNAVLDNGDQLDFFPEKLSEYDDVNELYTCTKEFFDRFYRRLHLEAGTKNETVVNSAKHYIANHIGSELSLNEISKVVFLSPKYFAGVFKGCTGENYSDYVARVKLEKAQYYLINTTWKISTVGEKIGYNDQRYFSQFFKKHTGMKPSKYRSLYLKNE